MGNQCSEAARIAHESPLNANQIGSQRAAVTLQSSVPSKIEAPSSQLHPAVIAIEERPVAHGAGTQNLQSLTAPHAEPTPSLQLAQPAGVRVSDLSDFPQIGHTPAPLSHATPEPFAQKISLPNEQFQPQSVPLIQKPLEQATSSPIQVGYAPAQVSGVVSQPPLYMQTNGKTLTSPYAPMISSEFLLPEPGKPIPNQQSPQNPSQNPAINNGTPQTSFPGTVGGGLATTVNVNGIYDMYGHNVFNQDVKNTDKFPQLDMYGNKRRGLYPIG